MKRPKDPKAYVAMVMYLTRPRAVMELRNGYTLYASKGMECRIIHVGNPKLPRVIFPDVMLDQHRGFEVPWSQLTEKRPICKCCKQSIPGTFYEKKS